MWVRLETNVMQKDKKQTFVQKVFKKIVRICVSTERIRWYDKKKQKKKHGLLIEPDLSCGQRHGTKPRLSVWSAIWQGIEGLPVTRVLLDGNTFSIYGRAGSIMQTQRTQSGHDPMAQH